MRMKKSVKYLILGGLLAWLAVATVFGAQLNRYLSTFSWFMLDGESSVDFYSQDHNVDFELAPGETLVLPVHFEARLYRVGVFLGEQEDSPNQYMFQLEDEYGSVLGKTPTSLTDLRGTDVLYVDNKSIISSTSTYYIKIFSDDANTDQQPLKIKVSPAGLFETAPFSVSEIDSEYTLILEKQYQAVSGEILTSINLALILVTAAIWIADTNIKEILFRRVKQISWRKVVIAAIGLFFAADVVFLFFPRTEYVMQVGNRKIQNVKEQAIALKEGVVVEQYAEINRENIDSLGILFATYRQAIKNGVVHIEVLDADGGDLLFTGSIETEKITDNSYQYLHLPGITDLYGRNILLRIWAEYADEGALAALYCSENSSSAMHIVVGGEPQNNSLIFEFGTQVKTCRAEAAIVITSILLLLVIGYIWKFMTFRQMWYKCCICVPLAAVLLLLPALSFFNFGEISLNGMTTLLTGQSKWAVPKTFEEAELKKHLSIEKMYDMSGEIIEIYERIEIPVNGMVSDVSLYFPGAEIAKDDYAVEIYWDTGKGYNARQKYVYTYIHQGANNVSCYIPCYKIVKNIQIIILKGRDTSETITPIEIIPFNRIEVNSLQSPSRFFSVRTLLIFVSIIGLLSLGCFWSCFHIEARLARKFRSKNLSISSIFVVIATIYGVLVSFLMPTLQVPDEGGHIAEAFNALGNAGLGYTILETIGEQGQAGVTYYQGQAIDIEAYIKASANRLDDYSLHGTPSVRVLQRPGQTIGFLLGMVFHLPAYWILQLGELGGLAIYIALGALTLRVIPFKKSMMMMIMLFPMAMQQAGSLSYDSFTDALSFFTVAYILYLKVEAKKVSWKQISVLFLLAVGLLIGKLIYVLLLGLILTVPLSKLELKIGGVTVDEKWIKSHKQYAAAALAVMGCVVCAGVWSLYGKMNVFEKVSGYISQFPQLLRLCSVSIMVHWRLWLQGVVAVFGWFDVAVNYTFIWMVLISSLICALIHHKEAGKQTGIYHREKVFSAYDLLIWYGLFVVLFVVVLMTMVEWGFQTWRIDFDLPYAVKMRLLPRIEGVQGRYFLPIVPLIFIPIHTRKDIFQGFPVGLCRIFYYLCTAVYPISLLLARYWGVGQR